MNFLNPSIDRILASVVVAVGLTGAMSAAVLQINDGAANFGYDDSPIAINSSNDEFSYAASGDTLFQESWHLAVDGTVQELANGAVTVLAQNRARVTYRSLLGGLDEVSITYSIRDTGSAGLLSAEVALTRADNGNPNKPLVGTLTNYFDYDLGAGIDDDLASFDPVTGAITVRDGGPNPTDDVVRVGNGFDRWQIGEWPSLLDQIADGSALTNQGSSFGPGDFTGAMQWSFSLERDETLEFTAGAGAIGNSASVTPEPSTSFGIGLLIACGLARRNRATGNLA